MTRVCDAFQCEAAVPGGRFLCSRHWRMVPVATQTTINTRYRAGRKDFAFLSDSAYLQACIDAINAVASAEGHTQPSIGESSSYGRLLRVTKKRAGGTDPEAAR